MAVDLQIVMGAVGFTDYLRVSAAKVSDPGTEVFVQYIDAPFGNYTLVIPDLDPTDYYVNFYDAPDNVSLGTLVSQAFVNAMTGEFSFERRFYTIGALPGGVSSTATVLTDPYLATGAGTVSGVFKEGFRYLEPDVEFSVDATAGTITLIGSNFSGGEKFIVEIKYRTGTLSATTASSFFIDTITVDGATYTVDSTDKGKRFMLDCTGTKQEVTLPALSALATGDIVYFEHKRDGVQAQSRIITAGTDKIFFNGFNIGTNLLSEIWVSKGRSLYLRKEGTYWEIIFEYDGVKVGERMSGTFKDHPNWLVEDGTLYDGDEYPAIYWWVKNVLPSTHKIVDDTVVSGGYAFPAGKKGLFVIHSSLKKFRLPNTQELSEKGLKDFDSYGADGTRTYDYPGGEQSDQNKSHSHMIQRGSGGSGTNPLDSPMSGFSGMDGYTGFTSTEDDTNFWIKAQGGTEVRVKNYGVIYLRHI